MEQETISIIILIVKVLFLLGLGWLGTKQLKIIVYRLFKIPRLSITVIETAEEQTRTTVVKHAVNAMQYIIWCCVLLSIFSLLQLGGFVQFVTLAGVVIGYIARDFANDIINGLVIIGERQFKVGDYVTINEKTGMVTKIGLRTTELLLLDKATYICANRLLTAVVVHPLKPTKKRQ